MSSARKRQKQHPERPPSPALEGLSTQEREVISKLVADEKLLVRASDVLALREVTPAAANQILSRLARKGWLHRLRRGVYVLVPLSARSPEPILQEAWPVAAHLFEPAFVSGWSAAEHWDLTEQIFNVISLVTTKKQRKNDHLIGGVRIRTRTLPEKRFFGFKKVWFGSHRVMIADPSRLIIDALDAPSFGGGARHVIDVVRAYWRSEHRNEEALLDHARRFGRGTVFKRLGFLCQVLEAPVSSAWLLECEKNISAGVSNLDPDVPAKGRIVSRWGLRINVPGVQP